MCDDHILVSERLLIMLCRCDVLTDRVIAGCSDSIAGAPVGQCLGTQCIRARLGAQSGPSEP